MKTTVFIIGLITGLLAVSVSSKAFKNLDSNTSQHPYNLTKVGFQKKKIKTSLGEMAVFEAGEGKPLLLLHGVGAGASSYLWYKIAPQLAKTYRVIAPDFIGWGESDRPAKSLLFDDYVRQIKALGEWVGEPVRVAAQSLTSGFAISAMLDGELSVIKIVLMTPSGGFDFGVDAFGKQATESFERIAMSTQREQYYKQIFHQKPPVEDWWRREGFLNGDQVPDEIIEANFYNAKQSNASYSALPFLSGTLRYDIAPLLEKVDIPAIMMWGDNEFRINKDVRERLAQINPRIKVITVENARTAFEMEQPEVTLNHLLDFL